MSVSYGGAVPSDGAAYAPPGRVNFGWIGEAYRFVNQAAWIWVLAILIYGIAQLVVTSSLIRAFPNPNYIPPPTPFGSGYSAHYGIQFGQNSNLTPIGQVIAALFLWTYGAFQNASLYGMAVKQVRGGQLAFGDAFGGGPRWAPMLLLNLILFFTYIAGIFALCVGLLVAAAFFWPAQAMVADGRSAPEALSASVNGMKQDWLNAVLLILMFGLLLVVSILPCGLGLFITIPMLYFMGALAYRDMVGMPGAGVGATDAPGYGTPPPGVWPPPPSAAPPAWPPPPAGQTPPPSFGQPPPPTGQSPIPSWQTPPPRQSLSRDPVDGDDNRPPGAGPAA